MIAALLPFAVSAVTLVGPGPEQLLAGPDEAYRAGVAARTDAARARPYFIRAAEGYESAWDQGTRSPVVARNMAQARYLTGDVGRCIRNYRRGLSAFPHDADLRRGLAFAREQVAFPFAGDVADAARPAEVRSPVERLGVPVPRLGWVAIGLWAVGWFILARAWFTARGGMGLIGGGLVLVATVFGTWLWWEDRRLRAAWAEPAAVVVGTAAELRTGNSDAFPKRMDGRLPPGVEVKVLGERGGWLHVELAGGQAGWVPRDQTIEVN